jgi:AcrR family transcriptional regulator
MTSDQSAGGDQGGSAVEAALERLWGTKTRPRRGPKPALSVERIVDAASDVADADGLAAVSMARVAEELGYSPMALYRYVSSKDELLVLMADRVPTDPPDLSADVGWREGLELWVEAQVQMAIERPWFLELPLITAPPGPRRLRWMDQAIGLMRELDLTFDEKVEILGLLAQHVLGEARVQVDWRRAAAAQVRAEAGVGPDTPDSELDPQALDAAHPYAHFEVVLTRLATPGDYPNLFEAAATWSPEDARPPEDDIGLGIRFLLDGVEAYVERRRREKGE